MSRKINLGILKRKSKKKKIDLHDGYDPVEVEMNPSESVKEEILKSIIENRRDLKGEIIEIDMANKTTFLLATKLITNIELTKQEEKPYIDCLFKDPSKYGMILKNIIIEVITNIVTEAYSDEIINYKDIKGKEKNKEIDKK